MPTREQEQMLRDHFQPFPCHAANKAPFLSNEKRMETDLTARYHEVWYDIPHIVDVIV